LILERREFGKSGLEVPVVGLGTWQVLDVRGPEERSRHEVVRAALEEGANLFDSSLMYGEAERVLGDALQEHGRERAIVATKVWTSNDAEAERQIENSLGYFGGRVELYQVHNLVAVESRLDTLERLKEEGTVRAVGATHYSRGFWEPHERDAERQGRFRAGPLQRCQDLRYGGGSMPSRTLGMVNTTLLASTKTPSEWCT
jgi:aryl-alcohol dehydrogenase-like predicted oxidoreductase